ncbi:hypothetical protein BJX66DRAFT_316138, partial [Aspergillus keveii]
MQVLFQPPHLAPKALATTGMLLILGSRIVLSFSHSPYLLYCPGIFQSFSSCEYQSRKSEPLLNKSTQPDLEAIALLDRSNLHTM